VTSSTATSGENDTSALKLANTVNSDRLPQNSGSRSFAGESPARAGDAVMSSAAQVIPAATLSVSNVPNSERGVKGV
jgi:hypothetical protein